MTADNTVKLVNPVGQRASAPVTLARRLATLSGKSIGFIDNMKPNANLFVQYIEEMIRAEYPDVRTHTVRKNYTSPHPAERPVSCGNRRTPLSGFDTGWFSMYSALKTHTRS